MRIIDNAKLLFSTPEFEDGQQITVRVGEKWRDIARRYPNGFRVPCFVTGREGEGSIGLASVTNAIYGQLGSPVFDVLACLNHQASARDLDGLFEDLAKFYPTFNGDDTFGTILIFEFAPSELYETITGLSVGDDFPEDEEDESSSEADEIRLRAEGGLRSEGGAGEGGANETTPATDEKPAVVVTEE